MNKLVISALAATVCAGTTNASDWEGLDSELYSLSNTLTSQDGASISGWFEAGVIMDNSVAGGAATAGDDDWEVGRNRVNISGASGDTGYQISFDLDPTYALQDAYLTQSIGQFGLTIGTFRAPTTSNHNDNENDQAFLNRAVFVGSTVDAGAGVRTDGVQLGGSFSDVGWAYHMDDAGDGTWQVSYALEAGGAAIGLSYGDSDGGAAGTDTTSMEVTVATGDFTLGYENSDFDTAGTSVDATSLTGSFQMGEYSISVRDQDNEDVLAGSDVMTIAIGMDHGGARWTIQHDDNGHGDGTESGLAVGIMIGF